MEQTTELQYALIDENNKVFNIVLFDHEDVELLETIKIANNAKDIISCTQYGMAAIGGTWTGEYFTNVEGERLPPTFPPNDNNIYVYDFDKNEWIFQLPSLDVIIGRLNNNTEG